MGTTVALAIDIGGTKSETALVTSEGTLLPGTRFRAETGRGATTDELLRGVSQSIEASIRKLPDDARLSGVGIGAAGPVEIERGLVSPLNLPGWRDFPLRDAVTDIVTRVLRGTGNLDPLSVVFAVDGLSIALAEQWVGAARGARAMMGMIVSTGIGGGIVLDGMPVAGATGNAGHIGHIDVSGFDDRCACGRSGCLEAIASGPRTVAWAREQGWTGSSGEELSVAYASGDEVAVAAVQRSGRAIGRAIASASALLDLEVVAIGGGFSRVTPDLFELIRASVTADNGLGFVTKTRVVASGLSDEGPLIGTVAPLFLGRTAAG